MNQYEFRNFDAAAAEKIQHILNTENGIYRNYCASDVTVQMFFSWEECDKPQYLETEDFIIVRKNTLEDAFYFPPVADSVENFQKGMDFIKKFAGADAEINLFPEIFLQYATADWEIRENANAAEYLYLPEDLIGLKGKHYHQKRNFVNRFTTTYPYIFREYTPSDRAGVLKMVEEFYADKEDVFGEYRAVEKTLDNLEDYGFSCDCILSDGKMVAFSVTYITSADVGVIIFEKAHVDYIGSYASLNNFTARKRFSSCKYISMQDDMGLENLRKAKESYHPSRKERKYVLSLKVKGEA